MIRVFTTNSILRSCKQTTCFGLSELSQEYNPLNLLLSLFFLEFEILKLEGYGKYNRKLITATYDQNNLPNSIKIVAEQKCSHCQLFLTNLNRLNIK